MTMMEEEEEEFRMRENLMRREQHMRDQYMR